MLRASSTKRTIVYLDSTSIRAVLRRAGAIAKTDGRRDDVAVALGLLAALSTLPEADRARRTALVDLALQTPRAF